MRYKGFSCGHIDPNATPLRPKLCPPPIRYAHEPMCDPPSYEYRDTTEGNCPACDAAIQQARRSWETQRAEWRASNALPSVGLSLISRELRVDRDRIKAEGRGQGPYHEAQNQYLPSQEVIVQAGRVLVEQLAEIDSDFKEVMDSVGSYGIVSDRVLQAIAVRRYNRRERVTNNTWDRFYNEHENLMRELFSEYERAAGVEYEW